MSIKHFMTKRFCLSLGAAVAVASVLVTQRVGSAPDLEGPGIVYVYFPSLCAQPGDSRDCRELPQPVRPGFTDMATCMAHAGSVLRQEPNPRVMASCMKVREG